MSQVLVGLHRVGVVGLGDAQKKAAASGLTDREALVDLIMEAVSAENYVPERMVEAYRTAMWREYLRFRGEDFSDFYSRVDVTVKGEPGEERDRLVEMLGPAFGAFELSPAVTFAPADARGPNPQLVIRGEAVARGPQGDRSLRAAVRNSISDW